MAIDPACSEGVLCKIAEYSTYMYYHPWVSIPALIVVILAVIGGLTVYNYYRKHGTSEAVRKGTHIFGQAGYMGYSVLKHLKGSPVVGAVVAAVFTLVGGLPHVLHDPHAPSVSPGNASPATGGHVASRDLVPVPMEKPTPAAAASPADYAAAADVAVKVAQPYSDRKIEVRVSDLVITIHPRGEQDDLRQT